MSILENLQLICEFIRTDAAPLALVEDQPQSHLSGGEMPNVRRKYLSPDEARRLIEAVGKVGRQGERDKLMLTLMYRRGLRVCEVIDLRWTDFDLDAPRERPFYVRRLKGSKDTMHTLEPDTVRALRRARMASDGQYVFRSEAWWSFIAGRHTGHCRAGWQDCRIRL